MIAEMAEAQEGAARKARARAEELESEDPILAAELRGMAAGFEASAGTLRALVEQSTAN